ncbi:hypothetical protein EIG55_17430 [Escherichia coli]|nr:hypothetical protein BVL39_15230 [Escherichia coli]EFN6839233.1 hypothetical protein [Escherichia coli H51]ESD82259.1 hypothetical protein HMPREF1611_03598 [Escherichia coli 908573]OYK27151.1 hypothetical protein CI722_07275 [Shigella sonnei]AUX64855.1 hypothetical protein CDC27_12375 [Escherichia coli]
MSTMQYIISLILNRLEIIFPLKTSVIIPYHFLLVIYRIQTSRDTSCIYYRVYIYSKFKSWRQQPFLYKLFLMFLPPYFQTGVVS